MNKMDQCHATYFLSADDGSDDYNKREINNMKKVN